MATLTASLPDASDLLQIGASVQSGMATLTQLLQSLQGGNPAGDGSPLAALGGALGGLGQRLNVDTSALGSRLPQGLATMGHALAPSALDFIRTLEADFGQAGSLLADSAVARAVADGQSLQQVALAAVQDALAAFDNHRQQLLGQLLPAGDLARAGDLLATLGQLATDYDAHRAQLLPLLSQYLLGHGPEVLAPVLQHVQQGLALPEAWAEANAGALLDAPLATLAQAMLALRQALADFDPELPGACAQIDALADAVDAALPPLCTALLALQGQARLAVQSPVWNTLFPAYAGLLQAIPLDEVPVPADAVGALTAVLEALLSRLQAQFTPEDVAAKVRALSAALHEVFAQSPLTQVRSAIQAFLQTIVEAIGAIPTDKISATLQQVLGTVGQQLQALGLAQAADQIEAAFTAVEAFITEQLNSALGEQVAGALQGLLAQLDALPVTALVDNVAQLIAQLQQAVGQIQAALQGAMDQLAGLAAQLDALSFAPVGDAVVGEINALRDKLAALNPNALSDVEKAALQAALAVVRAVDLQGIVQTEVKAGFNQARDAALDGLARVGGVLEGVRDQVRRFSPAALVQQLVALLGQARDAVNRLDGRTVMRPLYSQVDNLAASFGQARPGALLAPLQAPYQLVMDGVEQLDPQRLVAPLNDIYARIDVLIDKVNVVPLLEALDQREKALLADVRQALLAGLDGLNLPPPLDAFYALVKPVLQGMTEALLADPAVEFRRIGLDLSTRLKPSDLFKPLDDAHARLIDMLRGVPAQDLEAAFNALRSGVGVGLMQIDPARVLAALRSGRGALANWSPRVVLASAIQLPGLQARFELRAAGASASVQVGVAATRRKLQGLVARHQAPLQACIDGHEALDAALAERIRALDASAAQAAYARLAANLQRLLPDFLYSPVPLRQADILVGLRAARPSAQAAGLDVLFQRFQARLLAMQEVLDPAFAEFFNTLREPLQMISPLAIKDDVAAVYAALHAKVRLIDPQALAADLRSNLYDPVHAALAAVDPARLGARLDLAFQRALDALRQNVRALLDQVAAALDAQLQRLREAVAGIVERISAALAQAAQAFGQLLDGLEHLVFVELLERLKRLVQTLGLSFEREVDRVVSAFDEMLGAIPLGGARSAGVSL
jgi:hypothetical protein